MAINVPCGELVWMSTADVTAQTCMPLPTSVFHPHSRVHMLKNTLPHCAFFHTKTFSVLVTDCTWSAVDVVPWITLSFFYSFIYFNFEQWRRSETLLFQPGHSLTLMAPNTPWSLSNETGSLLTVMSWMHPTKADVTGSAVCIAISAVQAGQGCVIVVLRHIDFCHFCLILSLGSSSIRSGWWRHWVMKTLALQHIFDIRCHVWIHSS